MSDSLSVVSRVAAVLFLIAAGAGGLAIVTHHNLRAAELRIDAVENERAALKRELIMTEKQLLANSSAAKTCAAEVAAYKTRLQSAPSTHDDMNAKASRKS